MNNTISAVLLGMLLSAGAAAHAATTIDATGLHLQYTDLNHPWAGMTLLSDHNGTVSFRLNPPPDDDQGVSDYSSLTGFVQEGYRITSIGMSAKVNGTLSPGVADPCPEDAGCTTDVPDVTNWVFLRWKVDQNGEASYPSQGWDKITAPTAIAASEETSLQGGFLLDLNTETGVDAPPTHQLVGWRDGREMEYYYPSHATIRISDVTLTFQIAAVPEPGTYAMLLAGLALVGVSARRKARAA
jgi:hypothetical protein